MWYGHESETRQSYLGESETMEGPTMDPKKGKKEAEANLLHLVNNTAQTQILEECYTGKGLGRISHSQVVKDKEVQARGTNKVTEKRKDYGWGQVKGEKCGAVENHGKCTTRNGVKGRI